MTEKGEAPKQVQITPDTALQFIDEALANYEGNRNAHKILEASMATVRMIVTEWKKYKAEAKATMEIANESDSSKVKRKKPARKKVTRKKRT